MFSVCHPCIFNYQGEAVILGWGRGFQQTRQGSQNVFVRAHTLVVYSMLNTSSRLPLSYCCWIRSSFRDKSRRGRWVANISLLGLCTFTFVKLNKKVLLIHSNLTALKQQSYKLWLFLLVEFSASSCQSMLEGHTATAKVWCAVFEKKK